MRIDHADRKVLEPRSIHLQPFVVDSVIGASGAKCVVSYELYLDTDGAMEGQLGSWPPKVGGKNIRPFLVHRIRLS